jgi:hypothetical protein
MTSAIPPLAGLLVGLVFALATWTSWRWQAKDRLRLLTSALTAVVLMFAVQRVSDWSQHWLLVLWWSAVLVVAVGAAGSTLRWSALPWLRDRRHRIRRHAFFGIDLVVLAAIVIFFA